LNVFVDGMRTLEVDLDLIPPNQIEALEVYGGGISPPIEFSFGTNGCGVVLIWTRM